MASGPGWRCCTLGWHSPSKGAESTRTWPQPRQKHRWVGGSLFLSGFVCRHLGDCVYIWVLWVLFVTLLWHLLAEDFVGSLGSPQGKASVLRGSSEGQHSTTAGNVPHVQERSTCDAFRCLHSCRSVVQELTWSHSDTASNTVGSSSSESVWPELLLQSNIEQVH